jgi:hypothetical protein
MSFKSPLSGSNPRATASPPQKGSTYLRCECCLQSGIRWETNQRLPPAHFKGGLVGGLATLLSWESSATIPGLWTTKEVVARSDLETFVVLMFALPVLSLQSQTHRTWLAVFHPYGRVTRAQEQSIHCVRIVDFLKRKFQDGIFLWTAPQTCGVNPVTGQPGFTRVEGR